MRTPYQLLDGDHVYLLTEYFKSCPPCDFYVRSPLLDRSQDLSNDTRVMVQHMKWTRERVLIILTYALSYYVLNKNGLSFDLYPAPKLQSLLEQRVNHFSPRVVHRKWFPLQTSEILSICFFLISQS